MEVINTHSYILRQTSSAEYRLSHGVKPADYLIRNFRDSYNFLMDYGKVHNNELIHIYADNYLARVVNTYLLRRMALRQHSKESELHIINDVPQLWRNINLGNLKDRKTWLTVWMERYFGVRACVTALRTTFKLLHKI